MLEEGVCLKVSFTMLSEEKRKKKVSESSNDYFK